MTNTTECDSAGSCTGIDPETGQPEFRPLKTLDDVLTWQPKHDQPIGQPFSQAAILSRPTSPLKRRWTLVCHDFKGGYLEDRYVQGGQKVDPYYFCRWECIDIFVYFSHHFITVPPLGWIRAAHKHGVMMLGTLITEWDDGAATMSRVLSSKDTTKQLVKQLVSICTHYGFDGWLVNVENKIEAENVPHLREFVKMLTEESHSQLPGSKILWYDSVTKDGELKWQDQLNEENSMFFDVSDGIFLNYCWTPEKLAASKSVAEEKGRPFDVFVGVDVFGRGCPGGGGFNTREALQHVKEKGLSAAIFAPGWTLETLGREDFDENDCTFWSKIHDLCPLTSGGGLPLATAFCQGHGDSFFSLGQNMTGRPWYNMSMQQRQPERTRVYGFDDPSSGPAQASLNTCLSSAYFGGCSVQLNAQLTPALQTVNFRLFSLRTELDQTLYCSYTYKDSGRTSCDIFLVLTFGSGMLTRQVIMGPNDKEAAARFKNGLASSTAEGGPPSKRKKAESGDRDLFVSPMSQSELEPLRSSLWFHDLQAIGAGQSTGGWKTRHFRLDTSQVLSPEKLGLEESMSVAVTLAGPTEPATQLAVAPVQPGEDGDENNSGQEQASILLGHLQIFREKDLHIQCPKVVNMRLEKFDPLGIGSAPDAQTSYLLLWDVQDGDSSIDYFNIYLGEGEAISLVGHAATTTYVTTIPSKFVVDGIVTVTIQPVLTVTSLPQVLSKCPSKKIVLSAVS